MDTSALLPQVMTIAEEAGKAVMAIYDRPDELHIESKADTTPVTDADLEAHRLICDRLRQLTPEIPILSEESPAEEILQRRQWRRYWLIDPLDGTKEFIKRNGEFTVNIALIDNHRSVLGVVHVPATATTYAGSLSQDAIKRGANGEEEQIHCRPLDAAGGMTLLTSRSHIDDRQDQYIQQLEQLAALTVKGVGSSLKLCLIAEGQADLHLRLGRTCEWDTGAAQAVLEAAGGKVMDLLMQPLNYNQKSDLYNPDFIAIADPEVNWAEHLNLEQPLS